MNMKRGFTVVEVLITLVIMAILLTLGVVSLRGMQANARDKERQTDIETIARGLERYYNEGNPHAVGYESRGTYPGANEFIHIFGWDWCGNAEISAKLNPCFIQGGYSSEALPGTSKAAFTSPDGQEIVSSWLASDTDINNALLAGKYVYKPIGSSGSGTCYDFGLCARYELMYRRETDGQIITVDSKHQ